MRRIESQDPASAAKDFYEEATWGGVETPLSNGRGVKSEMSDGTIVTMRVTSSSDGSPAVDINISKSSENAGIKQQKIHFVRRRNEGH